MPSGIDLPEALFDEYLALVEAGALRTHAAEDLNLDYRQVVYRRKHNDEFEVAETAALEIARERRLDNVRKAIWERGVEGIERPIFNKDGDQVGSQTVYSDSLLLAEARKLDPQYNDRHPPEVKPAEGLPTGERKAFLGEVLGVLKATGALEGSPLGAALDANGDAAAAGPGGSGGVVPAARALLPAPAEPEAGGVPSP